MTEAIVKPKVAAFEVTGRCPLKCRHCRAAAVTDGSDPLDTAACKAILKGLADYSRCILIFTGGEPMMRDDIFDLVGYSRTLGLRPVMAACGEGLDRNAMERLKQRGLLSFSFSLDGSDAATHDAFRQSDGAFAMVMAAVEAAKSVGIRFQINTTLTRLNAEAVETIARLAVSLGAACWNPFVLVPVGRGDAIRELLFEPGEYESILQRLAELKGKLPIDLRLTCGPQFARVARQQKIPHADKVPGCLAATEFVFISRAGDVQTCGFLEQSAGNLVAEGFDFGRIWETSPLLCGLRNHSNYQGGCGTCGYLAVCRGCRARAMSVRGSVFAEDPICHLTRRKG
jgi:radical SAM protein with 4Fe4S-binding SPASM domain